MKSKRIKPRLNVPILPDTLLRERLFEQIEDSLQQQVAVWVNSPPGAGKTTLVASYVQEYGYPVLWYQLEAADTELATFFQYFAAAAKEVEQEGQPPMPMLTPEYLQGVEQFFRHYMQCLFQRLPSPCVLVFDNYQDVDPESTLHDFIAALIEQSPKDIYVIAISRQAPLKQLSRLVANRRLKIIDWDQIQFTEKERTSFLQVKGVCSPEEVKRISKGSHGWAAGLILMQQAAGKVEVSSNDPSNYQLVFDYFAVEVMRKTSDLSQQVLIQSALMPVFNVQMLSELSGQKNEMIKDLLSELYEAQYFTERHWQQEYYYQYHPLFRQYLLSESENRLTVSQLNDLQKRAANVLEQDGQIEEAAALMIKTKNWQALAGLCLDKAQGLLMCGRYRTLQGWLDVLPQEMHLSLPWLSYWQAYAQMGFDPVNAYQQFEKAYEQFKQQQDVEGQYLCWAAAVDCLNYAWDDFKPMEHWFAELKNLNKKHANYPSIEIECRVAAGLLSSLVWVDAGSRRFPGLLSRCYELLERVEDPNLTAVLAGRMLFMLNYVDADVIRSTELVESVSSKILSDVTSPVNKVYWYAHYAVHCVLACNYDLGLNAVKSALAIIDETGLNVLKIIILTQSITINMTAGNVKEVEKLLEKQRQYLLHNRRVEKSLYYYNLALKYFNDNNAVATQENFEKSLSLAKQTGIGYPFGSSLYWLFFNSLRMKDVDAARKYLVVAEQFADRSGNQTFRYESLLASAQLALYLQDEPTLRERLSVALAYARENGVLRMNAFGMLIPEVAPLFSKALEYGIEVKYVKKIILALRMKPNNRALTLGDWPWEVKIYTFSYFEVEVNGQLLPLAGKQKSRPIQLLKLLVVEQGKPLNIQTVMERLWPDVDSEKAETSYKVTVSRLRKLIGKDNLLQYENKLYLNTEKCWADAWVIDQLLQEKQLKSTVSSDTTFCQQLVSLYKGIFLPEDNDYWLLRYKEYLHKRVVDFLSIYAEHLIKTKKLEAAQSICQQGMQIDELQEVFYRLEMRMYKELNQPAAAIASYKRCKEILSQRIQIPPSAETESLYQLISRADNKTH